MTLAASCSRAENLSSLGKRYGVALVGLGSYSQNQLGPALLETKHCHLTGVFTGSPEKVPVWQKKYGFSDDSVYDYDSFHQLSDNEKIDIVYVVTPHGLHFKHTMAALKAGKHVIVEKPMAGTEEECRQMIKCAQENGVSLHTGYRLHHDPYHLEIMEAAQQDRIGKIKTIDGALGYYDPKPRATAWQIDKELSIAGALYSLGVYPIQAACYLTKGNPLKISEAKSYSGDPDYYKEVPQGYSWTMEFSDGVITKGLATSGKRTNFIEAKSAEKSLRLDPAYIYSGLKGHIGGNSLDFGKPNQQAIHMDAICEAIHQGVASRTPGEMGLRDVIILEAIMKAAAMKKAVDLPEDLGFPG